MMIVFLALTSNSWGKGKSLTEAFANLKKNHSPELEGKLDKFELCIYETENFDGIYLNYDDISINRGETDKLLYQGMENIIK
jgi:hypothetical protein